MPSLKNLFRFFLLLAICTGCAGMYQPNPAQIDTRYFDQIKEWQQRIANEGWTAELVDDVVKACIRLASYKAEEGDYWATPKEFRQHGFTGDCEDIAIFAMGTLKRLGYPYGVRILAVNTLAGDHAVLKVQVNAQEWKIHETMPRPLVEFDQLFYRPIVEFDENEIIYYSRTDTKPMT